MKTFSKILTIIPLVMAQGLSMDLSVEKQKPWTNWGKTQKCLIESLFVPKSEDELVSVVKEAYSLGKKVKVLGAGHSLGPIILPDEGQWVISMEDYAKVLKIDEKSQTITVQAGITLKQINQELYQHGFALENLPAISEQTVGGVIQTGTHGTGANHGAFHTQIIAMTIVNGKGELKSLSPFLSPNLFSAYQCGIGAMGIVNTVTFRVVPAQLFREKTHIVKWPDILDQFEELIQKNRHFRFHWYPYVNCVGFCTANPVDSQSIEPKDTKISSIQNILKMGVDNPEVVKKFNRAFFEANYCQENECIDRSDRIFNHDFFDIFDPSSKMHCLAMEAAFPACYVKSFLLELQQLIEENHFPAHGPIEVRFVKADQALLSPTYSDDSNDLFSFVSIISILPNASFSSYERYFKSFQQLLEKYRGRLHWGKMGEFDPAYLKEIYPKWEMFKKMQKEEDPLGIFLNDFTRKVLERM